MMSICCICCTYNRYTLTTRVLQSFLQQDYEGLSTLLIFNSGAPFDLVQMELPLSKRVLIINKSTDEQGNPFTSVGQKYNEAFKYVPEETEVICHMDSDDLFLPNYISDGIEGIKRAVLNNQKAFKPRKSLFKQNGRISLEENVFEPSIFIDYQWMREKGYEEVSIKYHQKWLTPLVQEGKILVDDTKPGFLYDWGGEIPVYKMSGSPIDNQDNFNNSQQREKDEGNGILIPLPVEKLNSYYKEIEECLIK